MDEESYDVYNVWYFWVVGHNGIIIIIPLRFTLITRFLN